MVQKKSLSDSEKVLEKQRAILMVASKLFRSQGFHSTGMREIATSIGMTVGNLYYYFHDKGEILAFCQEETLNRLLSLVDRVRATEGSAPDHLFELIVGHVRCLNEGIPGSLAHLEVPENFSSGLKQKRDRYEEELRILIREGIQENHFFKCDEKVATLAILGAVNWTVRWYRPDGAHDAKGIGEAFARQLVRGLMTEEAFAQLSPKTRDAQEQGDSLLNEENDG
jgi:AcrR family transcriptional regulator